VKTGFNLANLVGKAGSDAAVLPMTKRRKKNSDSTVK
jgi:hypothetical protein